MLNSHGWVGHILYSNELTLIRPLYCEYNGDSIQDIIIVKACMLSVHCHVNEQMTGNDRDLNGFHN